MTEFFPLFVMETENSKISGQILHWYVDMALQKTESTLYYALLK
jgi:hypothetical protein